MTAGLEIDHGVHAPRWHGRARDYQREAQRLYSLHHERAILPWSYVTTDCGDDRCLRPECMTLHTAKRIMYPVGVCVYCGDPAGTKDHLLPRNLTGDTLRNSVVVVPACGDCNSRINDYPTHCVTLRREHAHKSIRRGYAHLLERPIKTPTDLLELGPTLRSVAIKNNHKTVAIQARLAWPEDPDYDLRAFQHSGIEDPEALGLVVGHRDVTRAQSGDFEGDE